MGLFFEQNVKNAVLVMVRCVFVLTCAPVAVMLGHHIT